jgi:phosphopentomutase
MKGITKMKKYKRIFIIVCDSMGIGAEPDAELYGDTGSNTMVHIAQAMGGLNIPTMNSLGIGELAAIKGTTVVEHPQSYCTTLREESNGKDTMTGHWEMMGILTNKPFKTFTDTGFPKVLIDELEERFGRKIIGNTASSGTVILEELGEQQCKEGSLIVYTSADSVLQIAAHEKYVPLEELYRDCEIAREICNRPEYRLGRIIARPYLGTDKTNFKRTPNRKDYALSPTGRTAMDDLMDNGFMTLCVGKIGNIFNFAGVTKSIHTISDKNGMDITTDILKKNDFTGLCFVNLVEFDSEYGHRRNVVGYGKHIEEFDEQFKVFIDNMKDDDLVIITADHGNDPTWIGTDHTRERVPFLAYSPSIKNGCKLDERASFADLGATILDNFEVKPSENEIGTSIVEVLE